MYVDMDGHLRNGNEVGAAGHAADDREPAGFASHDLGNHYASMRFGRREQAVERVGDDVRCRVEADAEIGAGHVVVDSLRNADDLGAGRVELRRDAKGIVAADRDEAVDAVTSQIPDDNIDILFGCVPGSSAMCGAWCRYRGEYRALRGG